MMTIDEATAISNDEITDETARNDRRIVVIKETILCRVRRLSMKRSVVT